MHKKDKPWDLIAGIAIFILVVGLFFAAAYGWDKSSKRQFEKTHRVQIPAGH